MGIAVAAIIGALVGHAIRLATPRLLSLKNRDKPFNWPWLELGSALLLAHSYWQHPGWVPSLKWMLFVALLMAIVSCDYYKKLIPDQLSFGGMALGLVTGFAFPSDLIAIGLNQRLIDSMELYLWPARLQALAVSAIGLAVGFVGLELLRRVFSRLADMEVMGMGDAKLLGLIGAFIGPGLAVFVLIPASIIGIINGLVYRWLFDVPHSPFGPALALAGWGCLYYHTQMFGLIDGFYAWLYNLPPSFMLGFFLILLILLVALVMRMRSRAAEYSRQIDADYDRIANDIEQD